MEIRIILRGALSGFVAGVLGFVFARIFAEPQINKAIDYESGRDDILAKLNQAAGRAGRAGRPGDLLPRASSRTIGIATGIIAFSAAMGALIAVAYVVHARALQVRPRNLVWMIAGVRVLRRVPAAVREVPGQPAGDRAHVHHRHSAATCT